MKTIKIISIFFLVGILTAATTQVKNFQQGKVVKKKVTIEGNRGWINTGLSVKPRDRVTITVSGQVCFSNGDEDSCVDADGYQGEHGPYNEGWPNDYLQCDDPLPDENHASLIAEIGSEMFFVGKQKVFGRKNGVLYLGINDCSLTGDFYNTGEFVAIIKIEKNALKPL